MNMDSIAASLQSIMQGLSIYAGYILGLSAVVYLAFKIVADLNRGSSIDVLSCVKPIAFSILLFYYSLFFSLINQVFEVWPDKLTTILTTSIKQKIVEQDIKEGTKVEQNSSIKKDDDNWMSKAIIAAAIKGLVMVQDTIRFLFSILQKLSLSILYVMGPLIIAMEIFPGFGGSIRGWAGQIISLSLWTPLINLSLAISSTVGTILIKNQIDAPGVSASLLYVVATTALNIIVYLNIPSIAASLFGNGSGGFGTAMGAGAIGGAAVYARAGAAKGAKMVGKGALMTGKGLFGLLKNLMGKGGKANDFIR